MSNVAEYVPQPQEIAPVSETTAIISMIERAARDPNVDIDKFERLMAMKERVEADTSRKAFNEALAAAQAEIPHVYRDKENSHTRSRYATLEGILERITPVITRHGFSISYGMADSPLTDHYRVTCRVSRAGHSQDYHADLPADGVGAQGKSNKTGIQAFGSTVTYGRRYLVMMIFNVALKNDPDDDDGNKTPATVYADDVQDLITDEQADTIRKALTDTKSNVAVFLKFVGSPSVSDIPASRYKFVMAALAKKKAAQ